MPAPRAARLAPALPDDPAAVAGWFDLAATLLLSLDADGVVARANASACGYAGGAELAGAPVWETALVAHCPASAAALRDAVRAAGAGRRVTLDLGRRDADGATHTAEFTLTPAGGGVLAEGHDVTAARADARRQRDLLGAASHELRTPLVGVRGALAMLAERHGGGRADARDRDLVRLARANADRLMRCVTDLMDLEHIRGGAVAVRLGPTSAVAVARAAVEAVDPLAVERRVRLVVRDAPGAGALLADHDRTAQAVATLLSNAVYAAARGGTLRVVAARVAPDRVRVSVEDASGAIAPERRAALVRQVERVGLGGGPAAADAPLTLADALAATRESDADAGLGLAIARALVERQGGTLGACADADRATVCWVELPAAGEGEGGLVLVD